MSPPPQPATPASGDETALLGLAVQCLQRGDALQAGHWARQVLARQPRSADAHALLAVIAARSGDYAAAAASFAASLEIRPGQPAAQNNCGVALRRLGRDDEALARFQQAITLAPDYGEAHFNLANLLRDRQQWEAALQGYDRVLLLQPVFAKAYVARGTVLAALRRLGDALPCFDTAIALAPQDADAHAGRGAVLLAGNHIEAAIASLDAALQREPHHLEALENRAQAHGKAKRHDEAARDYAQLLALAPDWPAVQGNLLHARMLAADWTDFDALSAAIRDGLRAGRFVAEPFGLQGISDSEADLRRCAEVYCAREYPQAAASAATSPSPAPAPAPARPDGRITLGYVCGEFRQHATAILLCGVWEQHRKERFRLVAFDNGGSDGSAYRQRIEAAFDAIVDIRGLSDEAAAREVRQQGVDILVNLNGYYGEHRMGLFAQRPCAIQVNYLGFPGTLGAPYIDYLVADRTVIPPDSRAHYVEKLAWLPACYQATDRQRDIGSDPGPRAAHGLPAGAFVFCCFNNSYKITPERFAAWLRILQRVPGSVLWLLEDDASVAPRLRQAAAARGVAPERLVFAPRLPPAQHLARHRLADLFLDTLPYNAHTTASDALWAGLPLLTQRGTTFPGRVATSLLLALDLPELVTKTTGDYEEQAVRLATQPETLARLRNKLQENRLRTPLFDTRRFTGHLEGLFEAMMARHAQGLPPDHLAGTDAPT